MKAKRAFVGFVPFVERVLEVTLTPAQRVLALVAFDGVEPRDLTGDDRELGRKLFGDVEIIPAIARAVLVAVCGARGGKTYLAALRLLHLALTVPLQLAPGEHAFAPFIAPDMRLATQGLRYVAGAVRSTQALARCVDGKIGSEGFTVVRHDGEPVRFEALPATAGGSAVRGRTLVGVVMDEAAFFRDEFSAVNDEDIFRGFAPRIVPGGQALVVSTPWAQAGLLYKEFSNNRGEPKTAIAAHAPTTLLRTDEHTRALVAKERMRDPENARREFDAEFLPRGSGAFFDPTAIDASIFDRLDVPRGWALTAAIDAGFRSDASALVIVACGGEQFAVVHREELRPDKGAPLKPSEVIRTFAQSLRSFGVSRVAADQFYVEAVREHLSEHGIGLVEAPAGQIGKVTTHMRARSILHEGRLRMPRDERMLNQLKSIEQRPTAGGGLQIHTPRRAGGHGDIASALILALWAAEARPGLVDDETLERAFSARHVEPMVLPGEEDGNAAA
ncbi:MAG: hypothetical protein HYV09_18080 [Deltaproteobacteria bacterium]|nr:hypothetical protein [Deltaproteobacteria bacterium]